MKATNNTAERVIAVIADVLECDVKDVSASSRLESLGMDSLDAVQLVMELEDEFDITISEDDADAEDILTVGDIIRYIESAAGR